jgi:hypothetical protein
VEAECRVEAYPNTINYWTKQGIHEPEMLLNKWVYTYSLHSLLLIHGLVEFPWESWFVL